MSSIKELSLAIRFLSIDAVEKAQSGHPGMPLGMADIATVLWKKFYKHNPKNPHWFNRDRFVLSNGHGSMLLYSLLHLTGYNLSLDELKNFRQLHSKTPGHPECTETPGVETTTGPLGQGLANAVGMAIAEKILATQFNDEETTLVDHFTYAFAGDGCMMEGISHEACSLAGTLGLGKLIVFYDDNGISIDGKVDPWFTDDTAARFRAYHWHVIDAVDGHDYAAIEQAISAARQETTKPTLIICKTIIGYGSNAAGSEKVHGAPLGSEDIQQLRERFHWPHPPFVIPDALYARWNHVEQGVQDEQRWLKDCHHYQHRRPKDYHEFLRRINGDLPDHWPTDANVFIQHCQENNKDVATRKASQQCLEHYAALLPELLGGSADLTGSNNTNWSGSKAITHDHFNGNYLYYGVREFAMSAIMNGIALHGGFIPYGGTFLVFSDYARNAVRLSALMKQRVIYVYTHDSIGLGEDGPTHQPIEHAAMLRMTPDLDVWRPADLTETAVAWQQAIERHNGPSCLLLSRQNLPPLGHSAQQLTQIQRGGYILKDCQSLPDIILIATGSEMQIAVAAASLLEEQGIRMRVVSMPCAERFLLQETTYQEQVLPKTVRKRIAIEAAATAYWYRFVGLDGIVIGLDRFGTSAPAQKAYNYLGITVEQTVAAAQSLLTRSS
ncbi:transketolase [Legionella oakridgensis]|uniref:Transketolase n=2 Tax=Legionella oakridgensis TaxID=29423 RepID=W0B5I8_9GAMM|nr:transketolase [Legionella oakridgensis]AHE65758.1 transketolase, bacterial and yeast [Legionella oakridgensis ATCC 33761 = DSM 21215]KTD38169.1 transketolase [Legionella oakridgensis]STY15701.1 transketolase [Legionella longbeachae]